MMSSDLLSDSCPTYAVVDIKKKKKKVAESDHESSADTALYAVVNKKERVHSKEVYKNDHNIYSNVESESTEFYGVRQDEPQPTYSVQQDQTSDVNTPSSLFNYFGNKNKSLTSAGTVFQICFVITIITVVFLVFAFIISAAVCYAMISGLRSEITSALRKATSNNVLMSSVQYELELLENETYNNFIQLLANKKNINQIIMNTSSIFSDLRSENVYLRDLITDNSSNLLELLNQLNETTYMKHTLFNEYINIIINSTLGGHNEFSPAPSCRAIHILKPSSISGYYWVRSANGSSIRVYCDMTESCGNVTGGLTRVAILNNQNRHMICDGDFMFHNDNRCIRDTEDPGCSHMLFSLMNISYSHICGRVQGTWFGFPGGFTGSMRSTSTTINDNYVDGISLTYGNTTNRTHIWTFIADQEAGIQICPREKPSFVGNDYSCLMKDKSCILASNMCSHTFFRQLQQPITENIELRLCRDHPRGSGAYEGIYLGNFTIYVW